jgi:hypothetical protein
MRGDRLACTHRFASTIFVAPGPGPLLRNRLRNRRIPIPGLRFLRKQLHAKFGRVLRLDLGKDRRSRFCFNKAKDFDRFLIRHPLQPDCRVF